MPQKRLIINLSEILHLEIYCATCNETSLLPIKDKKGISIRGNPVLPFNACPFCHRPFTDVAGFQSVVDKLRESVILHELSEHDEFAVRLVIQK